MQNKITFSAKNILLQHFISILKLIKHCNLLVIRNLPEDTSHLEAILNFM